MKKKIDETEENNESTPIKRKSLKINSKNKTGKIL